MSIDSDSCSPPSGDLGVPWLHSGAGAKLASLVISLQALVAETQQLIGGNLSSPGLWSP